MSEPDSPRHHFKQGPYLEYGLEENAERPLKQRVVRALFLFFLVVCQFKASDNGRFPPVEYLKQVMTQQVDVVVVYHGIAIGGTVTLCGVII